MCGSTSEVIHVSFNTVSLSVCAVCVLSADSTLTLDGDKWVLGFGVGGRTYVHLQPLEDSEWNVDHFQYELEQVKSLVEAQNSNGQLRMRYI